MGKNVLSLADHGRVDVAGHLRELARQIESGEIPEVTVAVVILETRDTVGYPYILGPCDAIRGAGLMALSTAAMLHDP